MRPKLSFGAARPSPHCHLRRRVILATDEREQKPEQHLEIATPRRNRYVSAHVVLMLDTARRFTEAASDLPARRLTNLQV